MNESPPLNDTNFVEFNISLLDSVARATQQDIDKVRQALMPVLVVTFDRMPEMKKKTIAALYQREFDELVAVARSNLYFVGVHKIGNDLHFLLNAVPALSKKWRESL